MALHFTATNSQASLPAGVYPAALATIEERETVYGPGLRWYFRVETDGREITIGVPTSAKFSPTAKARQFAEVLLGRALSVGEGIDLETLYGRGCRVVITVAERDDHSTVNNIETVLPPARDAEIPF